MNEQETLELIVRGIDQGATKVTNDVRNGLKGIETQASTTSSGISRIEASLRSLGTWVKAGFGIQIGADIFREIDNGIRDLVGLLPRIVDTGTAYLEQLHQIQLQTGMTAEQTSVFVGVAKNLNISIDNLDPLLARLGKNLGANQGAFAALGVATEDSNGNMLGAYQIIQNLREQVAKHGEALLTTAAAQDLFGRGGYQLLPLLQMTDAQFKEATINVERWGGVMSQQAIDGAHQFSVALASLQSGITDIATNIFGALSPYLSAFVDAFSSFVQSHLQQIIDFAVQVAATVMGIIGGLFGFTVDFSKITADAYKAAAPADKYGEKPATVDAVTNSINAQVKAIDAQIAAISKRSDALHAAMEKARLDLALQTAQQQLADLKGNAPYTVGLSNAEAELARQKHAQDIVDAQKAVSAATGAITTFEADRSVAAEKARLEAKKASLQEELAAHKAADAAIASSALKMGAGIQTASAEAFKNIGIDIAQFQQTATAGFKSGSDAANSFLDILLGVQHSLGFEGTYRVGGVVGALQAVGISFDGIGRAAQGIAGAIGPIAGAFDDMGRQLDYLFNALNGAGRALHEFFVGLWDDLKPLGNLLPNNIMGLPIPHAAGGWVGLNGPELGLYGEKGPEYVIPHDQLVRGAPGPIAPVSMPSPGPAAAPGPTTIIHLEPHFHSVFAPSASEGKKLLDWIDEQLGIRADNVPVGMPTFGPPG